MSSHPSASGTMAQRQDEPNDDPVRPGTRLSLTAALLDVAATAVSFATPGHRGGRSLRHVEP